MSTWKKLGGHEKATPSRFELVLLFRPLLDGRAGAAVAEESHTVLLDGPSLVPEVDVAELL